jgi:hypothetical protein
LYRFVAPFSGFEQLRLSEQEKEEKQKYPNTVHYEVFPQFLKLDGTAIGLSHPIDISYEQELLMRQLTKPLEGSLRSRYEYYVHVLDDFK